MKNTPQLLKGFRDFSPKEKRARDFVMNKIVSTFQHFGFDPIETPTLEYKETIMGKYGDEADKLVYSFEDRGGRDVALRYDQTVPTARFIANNVNDLVFPFRRYQTQNVFRADKPQKGRYREFTQCDIDIFGSVDAAADAEVLACTYAAYKAIGFSDVQLLINDRQTLMSTLEQYALPGVGVFSIIQSIDKLDKQPESEVIAELVKKGLSNGMAKNALGAITSAKKSENLEEICKLAMTLGIPESNLLFSPTLARGLDYYTGMIFEVRIGGYTVGSVGGGGRYDNLIEQLCGLKMPAVGMAFGFDRTVEAATEQGLVPQDEQLPVLVTVFDDSFVQDAAEIAKTLRTKGAAVELYPGKEKLQKQLKYADKKGLRFVIIYGSNEKDKGVVVVKDLLSRTQKVLALQDIDLQDIST